MKFTQTEKELIKRAKEIIMKSRPVKLVDTSEVGSALITSKGNIYTGVSMGFYCGIGSCGEYQAIGSMVSNGEKEIKEIVALWYDSEKDKFEILPPCGKCREMMLQAAKANKNTEVIVSQSKKVKLKELMPYAWGGSIERK
jgi:cytidine deaminase